MSNETASMKDELSDLVKPFLAAMLAMDEPLRPEVVAQFMPEAVGPVHQAFAGYLMALQHQDNAAERQAADFLGVVERSGQLPLAWKAFEYLKAHGESLRAIDAAKRSRH